MMRVGLLKDIEYDKAEQVIRQFQQIPIRVEIEETPVETIHLEDKSLDIVEKMICNYYENQLDQWRE